MIDLKATLVDGSFHDVDSSEMAFKIAGSMAIQNCRQEGDSRSLEPMMKVEVEVPEDFIGNVIGDLNSRRGQIEGQGTEQGLAKVSAKVPWQKCLVMRPIFGLKPKVGVSSRWSLAIMKKFLAMLLKRSSQEAKGTLIVKLGSF